MRIANFPHPRQCLLLLSVCYSHRSDCEVVYSVILTFISQMTTNVENLFMCFLALGLSSLEKCLLKSFASLSFCFILLPANVHDLSTLTNLLSSQTVYQRQALILQNPRCRLQPEPLL